MTTIAIIIPARYASTRFPGKPLAKIGGKTMLMHTCESALKAKESLDDCQVLVTTEDERIMEHAAAIEGITPVLTDSECPSGSDRCLAALKALKQTPEIVINFQGDAPFTPPSYLTAIATPMKADSSIDVATPVVPLTWEALDQLRENKKQTPFSGTTAIVNSGQQAVWFSKHIIPAIRNESELRVASQVSPVFQHVGLYAFRYKALEAFVSLPMSHYERLEGLEQLRLLENGFNIRAVHVENKGYSSGIDTPEDVKRAEAFLNDTTHHC